eukprot:8586774-Pyramimonas_sp.AAC.1
MVALLFTSSPCRLHLFIVFRAAVSSASRRPPPSRFCALGRLELRAGPPFAVKGGGNNKCITVYPAGLRGPRPPFSTTTCRLLQ